MRRLIALAVPLLVVLAACGGDEPDAAASPPTTVAAPADPGDDAADEEPAAGEDDAEASGSADDDSEPEARAIDAVVAPEASTVAGLLALDRPVVAAHAGGDIDGPHSTMYAFTEAALAGVDVLEMDVMLTADDVLVVHHDDTVDRTTEASGRVRDLTYAELAALDNAHWFVPGTWSDQGRPDADYQLRGVRTGDRPPPPGYGPDDFRIETFRAVAEAFPDHVLDVEIKVQQGDDDADDLERAFAAARTLAAEIDELGRAESVIVVSFSDAVLTELRAAAPGVATSPGTDALFAWYLGDPSGLAPSDLVFQAPPVFDGIEVLTAETVERARADGFAIWAWMDDTSTQENAAFYQELVERGVDGLIVSRPAEGVAALGGPWSG
ncbi:MAG TPA: glycerophosphodiester phosphodiesterase family protein [Acidimicrobiales bacterium]|nr:glycerophosphodiester phosphodiesterase family protein [Acidimicrobiales bacterium]